MPAMDILALLLGLVDLVERDDPSTMPMIDSEAEAEEVERSPPASTPATHACRSSPTVDYGAPYAG
jgi:hypothetical protein